MECVRIVKGSPDYFLRISLDCFEATSFQVLLHKSKFQVHSLMQKWIVDGSELSFPGGYH